MEQRLIEQAHRYRRDDLAGPCRSASLSRWRCRARATGSRSRPGLWPRSTAAASTDADARGRGPLRPQRRRRQLVDALRAGVPFPGPGDTPAQELAHARRTSSCRTATATRSTQRGQHRELRHLRHIRPMVVETRDALGNRVTVGERNVDPTPAARAEPTTTACSSPAGHGPQPQPRGGARSTRSAWWSARRSWASPRSPSATRWTASRADLTQAEIDQLLADPQRPIRAMLLGDATTRLVYDLFAYQRTRASAAAARRGLHARPRDARQRPRAGRADQDPAQLLLLRRLRPRDPEEDPGRAGAGSPARRQRQDHRGRGRPAGDDTERRQPALGGQRLDGLQQQGQARPPVRAVLHRHPPLRVRRPRSASARCSSTTRSSASSPRCTPTTPGKRWSSTPGGRRPGTSTTRCSLDPRDRPGRRRLLRAVCRRPITCPPGTTQRARRARSDAASRTPPRKAAVHAGTPTVASRHAGPRLPDRRAQPVPTRHGGLAGRGASTHRVVLDIEGNQREVIDAKDRVVMRYDYDMLGNASIRRAWRRASAGCSTTSRASRIYAWDSRDTGSAPPTTRCAGPPSSFLREGTGAELLVGRTVYGETAARPGGAQPARQVSQVFDQAGVVTSERYDFKGNLLAARRQLARGVQGDARLVGHVPRWRPRPSPAAPPTTRSTGPTVGDHARTAASYRPPTTRPTCSNGRRQPRRRRRAGDAAS